MGPYTTRFLHALQQPANGISDNNNYNETLIKCEPLVYTRALRAVQRKKEEEKGKDSTTAIISSFMDSTPADTAYITHTHTQTHTTQQVK